MVPVRSVSSIFVSGPVGTPCSKDIRKAWPFWRTQTSSRVDEGVDDRGADAVQATGHLVPAAAELAAGVQLGEDELDGADALGGVHVGGDAAAVVLDPDARRSP